MGGSGGGLRLPLGKLAELQDKAKAALRSSAEPERRNIFISFVSEDQAEVELLRGQAKNTSSELVFNDWSLREPFDSERAEYIRAGIRERIRQSSVTVVYVSEKTHASDWVDWEIRESHKIGKGVVAMHKGERPPSVLPRALTDLGVRPIPWKHEQLMNAVDKASKKRPG